MQFMVSWRIDPAHEPKARARFLETGAPPPGGVTMVGRWHSVASKRGWLLAETDDAASIMRWTTRWSDALDFEIVPVLGDEDAGRVLSGG